MQAAIVAARPGNPAPSDKDTSVYLFWLDVGGIVSSSPSIVHGAGFGRVYTPFVCLHVNKTSVRTDIVVYRKQTMVIYHDTV